MPPAISRRKSGNHGNHGISREYIGHLCTSLGKCAVVQTQRHARSKGWIDVEVENVCLGYLSPVAVPIIDSMPSAAAQSVLHSRVLMSISMVRLAFVKSVAWVAPPVSFQTSQLSTVPNIASPDRTAALTAGLCIDTDRAKHRFASPNPHPRSTGRGTK